MHEDDFWMMIDDELDLEEEEEAATRRSHTQSVASGSSSYTGSAIVPCPHRHASIAPDWWAIHERECEPRQKQWREAEEQARARYNRIMSIVVPVVLGLLLIGGICSALITR